MDKKIKIVRSKILGEVSQDASFEDYWNSKPIRIPLIGKELNLVFMDFEPEKDESFIQEADSALDNFLKLGDEYRHQISGLIYDHFRDFCSKVGKEDIPDEMKEIDKSEIWKFISPSQILIARRPYNEPDIFINMTCQCKWEKEHGLQLVFKKGKALTRVSDQDGYLTKADAYNIPDSEDELLAKFEE
ncbi:DUF6985 domain-containing protein [Nonlabens xiamenensis]|uniref:DUF6985 domain-containing protein n=1 Tax=Nonlabens xiamenensis TaxID=2341043 RepID=UPI000F604A7A|nr:hypothetical protein [Nonlabens xiamenensis]